MGEGGSNFDSTCTQGFGGRAGGRALSTLDGVPLTQHEYLDPPPKLTQKFDPPPKITPNFWTRPKNYP